MESGSISGRSYGLHENISQFRRALPQIIAIVIKNVVLFVYGTSVAMPTILIPNLSGSNEDESIVLDPTGISWIASLNHLCVPIGCLFSGALAQPLGRKKALQLVSVPFLVAFVLYYCSTDPWHVFLGLSLAGISGGLSESPALSYAAEATEPKLRGALTSTATLVISLGILFTFTLSTVFSWRTVSIINATIPFVGIFLLMVIPETPYWLISKNRLDEGRKSLAWLRGWSTPENVAEEFGEIQKNIQCERRRRPFFSLDTLSFYLELRFFKPFSLILLTFVIGHFGTSPISVYAIPIFNRLQVPVSAYGATVLTGSANLAAATLCALLLKHSGKRLLTFVSLAGVCSSFAIVSAYSYIMRFYDFDDVSSHVVDTSSSSSSWIPLASLVAMGFFSYLMIYSLPWLIMGEVYHNEIRDVASGVSAAVGYLTGFLANKTFPDMAFAFTLPGVFAFYSGVAAVGLVVLYFVLPETEGKNLFEISEHFNGGLKIDNKVGN